MDHVVIYRTETGQITVCGFEDNIYVFPDLNSAITFAESNKVLKSGDVAYQIVELDEL